MEHAHQGQTGHIVAANAMSWGHNKSSCSFVCKLVRLKNIYATIIVGLAMHERLSNEIERHFIPGDEDHLKAMVRVVAIETDPSPKDMGLLQNNIVQTCEKLITGQPVKSHPSNGVVLDKIVAPQAVLLDYMLYDAFQGLREVKAKYGALSIYAFQSCAATAMLFLSGPEELGGNGDLLAKLEPVMNLPNDQKLVEAEKIYRRVKNELLRIPGLPPMHDYEFYAQKWLFDASVVFLGASAYRFFRDCDGIVMNSSPLFEGPALDAWQTWFGDRPVVGAGPVDFELVEYSKDTTPDTLKVIEFLDSALEKHGANSVVYLSFGSMWWSTEPEKIWAAIDVFIELGIPFLFSHPSPFAAIPTEVSEKIKTCGHGLHSSWMPQTEILRHKACGWFVSHCGQNSIMESLSEGIPIICWPFEIDQPANAANVAFQHNMGYELFEIRNGPHGLQPIHRTGGTVPIATVNSARAEFRDVLTKAIGEDGKQKRENALRFSKAISESWKTGGDSWKELEKIAKVLRAD